MNEAEWTHLFDELRQRHSIRFRGGVDEADLIEAERSIGPLPEDLRSLYKIANGFVCEWFNLLPVERASDLKDTWDGIKRANDFSKTKFLYRDQELLKRFVVFAHISAGHCGCFERSTGTIWFQDDEGVHGTDLTLRGFIEVTLREVSEL